MLARRTEQGLGLRISEGGEETYKPGTEGGIEPALGK